MRRIAFSFALFLFVGTNASAQGAGAAIPGSESEGPGMWFELGAGVGKAAGAAGNAALSASVDWRNAKLLVSGRGDALSTSWSSSVAQIGLLAGRASTRPDGRFASASAGVGFVHADQCVTNCGLLSTGAATHESRDGVGVSLAMQGALRAGHRAGVGIGIAAFGNVNSISSFAGVTLTLSGGRWR